MANVTLPDALMALATSWDDVVEHLDDEQRVILVRLAEELLGSQGTNRRDVALDMMELVMPALPPGHQVRRAFATESKRFDRGSAEWQPALVALRPHMAELRTLIAAGANRGDIKQETERSLLAKPALDAAEVRRRGADPRDPGLIRLRPPGGGMRLPAFQFGADGQPYAVVTTINRLLDAEEDPWGVADWWLGVNTWVGAVPADVIGEVDDQVLIEAARAAFEEA